MDWATVVERLRAGEDERTELGRYRSFAEKDWLEATVALANSEGGLVVLGATDDGTIDGVPMDPSEVQQRLTDGLQSAASAPIRARLGWHDDPRGRVHWIEVARMRGPEPLRLRGRVLVRRGRSSVEPNASELQELYNVFGLVFTEERLIPGTAPTDVDEGFFRTYLKRKGIDLDAEPRMPIEVDLTNREVVGKDLDGTLRVTLFGLMCFGRNPQGFGPTRNFWVDLVAYAGTDRGAPVLLSGQAMGRLDEQVDRAEGWLRALGRTERYQGLHRIDTWIVPLPAFRECIVNAVVHRDYAVLGSKILVEVFDDRVSITSPGALPNHKRPESVLAGGVPRSRNEGMANVLLDLRYMEQRGSGYPRIIREMEAFNGTRPVIENEPLERWFRVTLSRMRHT
jgi:ATP-dependent DNA helicase RecG